MSPRACREKVLSFYKEHGRHTLPWRKTRDPYRILASEIMLQQTQVERVIPYYTTFLASFPTIEQLAQAPLSSVLTHWQGLGYNRRAKMLHEAARVVVKEYGGRMPRSAKELSNLPGVGPYTAGAVAAFAYNEDVVLIETNIRTVLTHHFFPNAESVSDKELLPLLEKLLPKGNARTWYAALMDYGSYLKRSGVRINKKSASYIPQSTFKGSAREARGAILRALSIAPNTKAKLRNLLGKERIEQVDAQIEKLLKEELIQKVGARYQLPD